MAHIDSETINKIRQENDIVDIIGEYIPLTNKGKNYFCVCPFHDDHSPSMSVSSEKQIYSCFSCGATGNVYSFLMNYNNMSFLEAVKFLADKAGISVNVGNTIKKEKNNKELYDIYEIGTKFYKNNLNSNYGKKAIQYLKNRGLEDETIKYFDIGLSLSNNSLLKVLEKKFSKNDLLNSGIVYESNDRLIDIYRNRIMFPIKDNEGNYCAFSGRIYNNEDANKYINTKETLIFKKSKVLYNYFNAKESIRKKKEIIICEGFMDVIRLHTIGITNSVALMGTSFTDDHLNVIKKLNALVVLNLDRDGPGKEATLKIGRLLQKENIKTKVIVYNGAKDSDEYVLKYGAEAFIKNYDNKVDFIDFELDYLKEDVNINDAVSLSKYLNQAIDSLNLINDDILLDLKVKELVKKYDVSEDIIYSKIKKKEKIIPKKEIIKKSTKKLNKCDKSELRVIYLMLNYKEIIEKYELELGFMTDKLRSKLASNIVYFKDVNKGFDYADFISFISSKPELLNVLEEVNNYSNIEGYTEEEVDDYFITIRKSMFKKKTDELKLKMKETLDVDEKMRLLKKIEKIKKDVLEW